MMTFQVKPNGQMILTSDAGQRHLMNVLLTFRSPDFRKAYVLLYPATKNKQSDLGIRAYVLPPGADPANLTRGTLSRVGSKSEWDMIESVLNTFLKPD